MSGLVLATRYSEREGITRCLVRGLDGLLSVVVLVGEVSLVQ